MYSPGIDTDIPLADFPPTFQDLRQRVDAAFASLAALDVDEVEVSDADEMDARDLLAVVNSGGSLTPDQERVLSSPGVVLQVKTILSEYDHVVVQSAAQIRTFVTNKLILEAENPDARIRMRALELLGKISDVGLFTDKTEVTLRHRPTAELEQLLRERMMKTIDAVPDLVVPRAL